MNLKNANHIFWLPHLPAFVIGMFCTLRWKLQHCNNFWCWIVFYLISTQALKIAYKLSTFLLQKDTKINQRLYAHKDCYLLIAGSTAFFTMSASNFSWSLRFVTFLYLCYIQPAETKTWIACCPLMGCSNFLFSSHCIQFSLFH